MQQLWEMYFERLVDLARQKMKGTVGGAAAEDVAIDCFVGFWKGMQKGQYPQLLDRNDLWHLLAAITVKKALKQREKEHAQKRGGGKVFEFSALAASDEIVDGKMLEDALAEPATQEIAVEVAEDFKRLLDSIPDEKHRVVAKLRMEGFTNGKIADICGCSVRHIERRLDTIRETFSLMVEQ